MKNKAILKKIDYFFWSFACLFVVTFKSFFDFSKKKQILKYLIIRPGGMGDLIHVQMAMKTLNLQSSEFIWLIENRSKVWAELHQLRYYCYDDYRDFKKILNFRFSFVLNSEQFFGLSQALALLLRKKQGCLIGFNTNRGRMWSDKLVKYKFITSPEYMEFQKLFFAVDDFSKFNCVDFKPTEQVTKLKRNLLFGVSGTNEESRHLSVSQWELIIKKFAGSTAFNIVFAPQDRDYAVAISKRFVGQAKVLELNFGEICDEIKNCERLLTIDGGLVHVGSYFGVSMDVVFTSGVMAKWKPLTPGSRIIKTSGLDCQPCTRFGQTPCCRNEFRCKLLTNCEFQLVP